MPKEVRLVIPAVLAMLLAAVAIAFTVPPYKVGMSAEEVQLKMVLPLVEKQMQHRGRQLSRISSASGGGLLEVWTDYYVWQRKPLFTHWYTCALDTNGVIVKVGSSWDWRGLP